MTEIDHRLQESRASALLGWLEERKATLFLIAGAMVALNAVIVAGGIVGDSESLLTLGEAFNAAGWIAALFGLLGLHVSVADRNRWLARIGALCATLGVVAFVVLTVASFLYGTGIVGGEIDAIIPFVIPGVLLGSVIAFILYSVAVFRAEQRSTRLGLILLVPPVVVLFNIITAGLDSPLVVLGVVIVLSLVFFSIGRTVRAEYRST